MSAFVKMSRRLLVLGLLLGAFVWPSPAPEAAPPPARPDTGTEVDLELVLAVDISYSMDMDELALQRQGYVEAITSPEFIGAVRQGMLGRIAVTFIEWAGASDQRTVVPWMVVDGPQTAEDFAARIAESPIRRAQRTSISGALLYAREQFELSGFRAQRRVIDVSGDGANNQGRLVTEVRDELVAASIVINGLPLMLKRPNFHTLDIDVLDIYYEDCVIGGPGAFVITVRSHDEFRKAVRAKLVQEVAGLSPRVIPAQAAAPRAARVDCTIGERMWQERWGNRYRDP